MVKHIIIAKNKETFTFLTIFQALHNNLKIFYLHKNGKPFDYSVRCEINPIFSDYFISSPFKRFKLVC